MTTRPRTAVQPLLETDLLAYYEVKGKTEAERIERAMERLEEDIAVTTDRETGVVRFSVTTSDPLLSQGVAQHILDLIEGPLPGDAEPPGRGPSMSRGTPTEVVGGARSTSGPSSGGW